MSESKVDISSPSILPGSESESLNSGLQSCGAFSLLLVGQGKVLRKYSSPKNVSASTSTSTSKASKGDSTVKSTQDHTIEEDVFTLGEQESKSSNPRQLSHLTRVCLYKVEPTFLEDPMRRADLARALPTMHAVVFVCSTEDKHNRSDPVAQYEGSWLPFVNEHANRHMLRAFVVPPSTASAPGCDVQVKPTEMGGNVHMCVKNVSNSDDVRGLSIELLQLIRSSLPGLELHSLLSSQALPSASSDLPSTGTRTLLSFSEASQVGNDRISLADVMIQMQVSSNASKLLPSTSFTS